MLTLRRHWDRAGARAGPGAIEDADADRVVDLLAQPPASPAYAVRAMHPLELWFLGLLATDHAAQWPILTREWARANPLATALDLTPRRRYASRGRSRPVRLPPVTPTGLAAGQTVGDLLTSLVEQARTQPQTYASIGDVERALVPRPRACCCAWPSVRCSWRWATWGGASWGSAGDPGADRRPIGHGAPPDGLAGGRRPRRPG